jgi:DNA-directed RNA polymerase specialized sigma24 family protein
VQDALLAAHKHLHQFRGQSQMSTWLTTIVSNCARMQLRKRPRQIQISLDEQIGEGQGYFLSERLADGRPSPEAECRTSELAAHLCLTQSEVRKESLGSIPQCAPEKDVFADSLLGDIQTSVRNFSGLPVIGNSR